MDILRFINTYNTQEACIKHLEKSRWPTGPVCPKCGSQRHYTNEGRYRCLDCKAPYWVGTGTMFEDTKLPLQKWFLAILLTVNAKKGLSARQLHRDLGVARNTANRIAKKIKEMMAESVDGLQKLAGEIEMDDMFPIEKKRKPNRKEDIDWSSMGGRKTTAVAMVERGGNVKTDVVYADEKLGRERLQELVRGNVELDSRLLTDGYRGYAKMSELVRQHDVINHNIEYAVGDVNTNTVESFWSLVKRCIVGQHHKVSAEKLGLYLAERAYMWNNRFLNPDELFSMTLDKTVAI